MVDDTLPTAGDMAAFGASHHACYEYPQDTDIAKAQRAAFCEGAAWSADRIEKLQTALSALLVEYVAGRKEGHIDSFPASARKVVADATEALAYEQSPRPTEG